MRSAQAGDRDAFGRLYERFSGYVYAILLVQMPRPRAEDLVQEVFLAALERLGDLREPAAFPGWIASIARRRAVDAFRRPAVVDDARMDGQDEIGGAMDRIVSPGAAPDVQVEAAQALAAIRRLPEAYRETLVLRLVQGMTGPEIASVTGLSPESVRVNLHRGFKLLRAALGGAPTVGGVR